MATEELECCEDCQIHPDRLDIVNSGMPEEEELYDLAELFKVFGDSTRIRILFMLFEAEVCVCDLAETLHMTQSAISHQLRILKQSKLVKSRRFFILWQTGMCVRSSHRAANILKKNKRTVTKKL